MIWREILLGEGISIKHGYAFKSRHFVDSGRYIVLTPGNFHEKGGFRGRPDKDRAYAGDIPEDFVLSQNDIVVAMTEQGPGLLGSSALIPEDECYLHNQRLGLVEDIDPNLFDRLFLYYLFNTRLVRHQINASASGTKVRHTAPKRIYNVKVRVPKPKIQRKIALTLKQYDDLIENNRRRIQLLEESARLLYKEWFVHLRFPGHEHVAIIDGVPEGWEHGTISSFYRTSSGGTPSRKKSEFFTGDIRWVKTQELKDSFIFNTDEKITEDAIQSSSAKLFPENTVLVAMYGATVGKTAILANPASTNQACCALMPKSENIADYIYAFLFLRENKERLINLSQGAAQNNINQETIRNFPMTIPTKLFMRQFIYSTKPLFEQIKNLQRQSEKLAQSRDLLLPRLMNGEIAV